MPFLTYTFSQSEATKSMPPGSTTTVSLQEPQKNRVPILGSCILATRPVSVYGRGLEEVVASPAEERVVALPFHQEVIAPTPHQDVISGEADYLVAASTTVEDIGAATAILEIVTTPALKDIAIFGADEDVCPIRCRPSPPRQQRRCPPRAPRSSSPGPSPHASQSPPILSCRHLLFLMSQYPLYSGTVSQALRQTLRGGVPKEDPPAPATPRGHCGGPKEVEVGDTSLFTSFSLSGEYIPDIFSERRGCVLRASVAVLMVEWWSTSLRVTGAYKRSICRDNIARSFSRSLSCSGKGLRITQSKRLGIQTCNRYCK